MIGGYILCFALLIGCSSLISFIQAKEIYDPMNIFCGTDNCYDILGVAREAKLQEIKKAYRRLSLTHHPDKNKESNATDIFRTISKAYEVLEKNDSRSLFDYYLDNPRDYFKVSGHHYFHTLPKSDVRIISIVVILLFSFLQFHLQKSKHERILQQIFQMTINCLTEKQGATKETLALFQRGMEVYNERLGSNETNKQKLANNSEFQKILIELIANVEVEGGYRKASWKETLMYQLPLLPLTLYQWGKKYYRRNYSNIPFTKEEMIELVVETITNRNWMDLDDVMQARMIELEVWKSPNRERWYEEGFDILLTEEELQLREQAEDASNSNKTRKKAMKKMAKRMAAGKSD